MSLNLGGIIRLSYAVKNAAGTLVNPTTATLTITQPDGTTTAPSVTLPPSVTGTLVVDFTPVQSGLHSVHWATTTPTTADDDVFTVERAGAMLVSVDEAISHLRAAGVIVSDPDREQLQWLCLAATDAIERDLGRPVVRRTFTETYDGGCSAIVLRRSPVISITSVAESAAALGASGYVVNAETGILYRGSSLSPQSFSWGRQNVTVVYVAGYTDPPRIARKVALNAVQGMWQESQQAPHPGLNEFAEEAMFVATGALTWAEKGAYDALRVVGVG